MLTRSDLLKSLCLINGQWQGADNGDTFPVTNPANGETITAVPRCGVAETNRAIDAANAALPEWRSRSAKERAVILRRWFDLIMANQKDLAIILTQEQGKPLAEASGEVAYGAAFIEWFAEEARRVYGDILQSNNAAQRMLVLKQPIGVVAAITPWNFPVAMITRKAGPALAAGCTVVIKPASETPLSALALVALAEEAGVPAGVINVVTGSAGIIGPTLTQSPIVRKLSFTGSTEIGRRLMAESADTLKKLSLELGGNAPFIVFEDADLDLAVQGAMVSKYRNSGQTCVCSNRFLVHEKIHDSFVEKLFAAVSRLTLGAGWESGVTQGPLINMAAVTRIEAILEQAVIDGANIICGGKRSALGGLFFEPTIITGVRNDSALAQIELFAPVAPVIRFSSDEEAVRLANDSEFGLASYMYTRDINRIFRVSEALEYGMVGINEGLISTEVAPFGGIKASGFGREGSKYGVDEYMEKKYICIGSVTGS